MTLQSTMAAPETAARPRRPLMRSLGRGLRCRCPNCGTGRVFDGYLKVRPACPECGEDLTPQRADDLPPYLTIVVVGHIIVPLILIVQTTWALTTPIHLAIWLPLTLILTLALLRPMKGLVVGLQWALYMHGFDRGSTGDDPVLFAPLTADEPLTRWPPRS